MITSFYARENNKKKKLAVPPDNSSTKDYENFFGEHETIFSFKTNRLLPVMNICEMSDSNGYKELAEYKATIIELASCNLPIFHHDRAWLDSDSEEGEEVVNDITDTMRCPCNKNDGEVHVKYKFDSKGGLYVCNGYMNQVAIDFNEKFYYMATCKNNGKMPNWQLEKIKDLQIKIDQLKRDGGSKKMVRRLRSRLDEKQIEIINILENHRKEISEKDQERALLKSRFDQKQLEIDTLQNEIKKLKNDINNLELKNTLLSKSKRNIEKYVQTRSMTCTGCDCPFLRSEWGAVLNCGHILCLKKCAKRMFGDKDYHDPVYPLRMYSKDGRQSCPQCSEMSEFCTACVFQ